MAEIRRTLPGLAPFARYAVRVRAFSSFGVASSWSEILEIQTPGDSSIPNPPTDLTIDFDTPTLILGWTAPTENTDGSPLLDFQHYEIIFTVDGVSKTYTTTQTFFVYGFDQNASDFGTPSPIIDIQIRTVDVMDLKSEPLEGTAINPVPSKPQDLEIAASFSMIVLMMTPNPVDRDIKDYILERAPAIGGSFDVLSHQAGNSYVDQVSASDTFLYRYRVRDYFNQISEYSEEATASPLELPIGDLIPPAPVTDLTLHTNGIDEFTRRPFARFIWSPNNTDDDLAYYEIRIVNTTTNIVRTEIKGPGASDHTFYNLEEDTEYDVALHLFDYSGNRSSISNVVTFTTLIDDAAPDIPTGTGTISGIGGITVYWQPVSDMNLSHYEVYASTTSGFTPDESNKTFVGNANRYIQEANPGVTWYFRVRAVNYNGIASDFTDEFSGVAAGAEFDVNPPTNVSGVVTTSSTYFHGSSELGRITVAWPEAEDDVGVSHYILRVREGNGDWSEITANTNSHTLYSLTPGFTYYFQVKAVDFAGNRSLSWSTQVQRTITTEAAIVPGQVTWPAIGSVESLGVGSIKFTWNRVTNVSIRDYEVTTATNASFSTDVRTHFIDGTSLTITGSPGLEYFARVRARSTYGGITGAWSSNRSAVAKKLVTGDIQQIDLSNSNIFVNRLNAGSIVVGSTTQYSPGYDPSTKATPAQVSAAEAAAKAYADGLLSGQTTTYYQPDDPALDPNNTLVSGDVWVQTTPDEGNHMFIWNGTEWLAIVDPALQEAIDAAQAALALAQGKTKVFYSDEEPLDAQNGDLWFDTGEGLKPYVYNNGWHALTYIEDVATAVGNTIEAAIRGDYGHTTDTTRIDGGRIFTGSVDAEVLRADIAITNGLRVQSLFQINEGGTIESTNFDSTAKTGFRLTDEYLEMYQGSMILGDEGLNINTETDQLWFGSNDFNTAKWRVASDGSMRVGISDFNFNVDSDGNLYIGGNTPSAPVHITAAGAATFRNLRITGSAMSGSAYIIDTTNFKVTGNGAVLASSLNATNGYIGGVEIDGATGKLVGGIIEGANFNVGPGGIRFTGSGNMTWEPGANGKIIVSNTGAIESANYSGTSTGWQLGPNGLVVNDGSIRGSALQISISSENLLENSAFATDVVGPGVPTGWLWNGDADVSVASDASSFLYFGKSMKIVTTSTTMQTIAQSVNVPNGFVADEPIMVSAWMRNAHSVARIARVVIQDSSGTTISPGNGTNLPPNTWVRISHQHRLVDAHPNGLRMRIEIQNALAGETFYIDGAQFERSDFITDYKPRALDIPRNYIDSAWISHLNADKLRAGTIGPLSADSSVDIHVGPQGQIFGTNWLINQSGAIFENGSIQIFAGGDGIDPGYVKIDGSSLRLIAGGTADSAANTKFKVDKTGVYIGGSTAQTADIYFDGSKTTFRASGTAGAFDFLIDTQAPIDDRVLRLTSNATDPAADTFYLRTDGSALFKGGTIFDSDLDGNLTLSGSLFVGGHVQSTVFNNLQGWKIEGFGSGHATFNNGTFRGSVSIREPDQRTQVNLIQSATITNGSNTSALNNGNKLVGDSFATVTASSGEGTGDELDNYFQVDFGDIKDIAEVRAYFYHPHQRSYYYKWKASEDGVNWYHIAGKAGPAGWLMSTQAAAAAGDPLPTIDTIHPRVAARYLRLYVDGNTVNSGCHVLEVEAFAAAHIDSMVTVGRNFRVDVNGNVYAANGTFAGNIVIGGQAAENYVAGQIAPVSSAASSAQSAANSAQSTANSAQSTANSAQSTANTANTNALNSRKPPNWESGAIASGINIRSGNFNTSSPTTSPGWGIYADGSAYFNNGSFRGNLLAGTIAIGGTNAFRVDANGNMWLGGTSYAGASFRVSSTGSLYADSGTFAGTVSGASVNGGTITGAVFRTSTSGARVLINGNTDRILFYNSAGTNTAIYQGDSTGLETSGSLRLGGNVGNGSLYGGYAYLGNFDSLAMATNQIGVGAHGIIGYLMAKVGTNAEAALYLRRDSNGIMARFYHGHSNVRAYVGAISIDSNSTAFNTSSDYRLKKDVETLPAVEAVARIQSARPVSFVWKNNNVQDVGYIAHELDEVMPQAVTGAKDAVDSEGNPDYQGVDSGKLIPDMHRTIQFLLDERDEMLQTIESLNDRLAAAGL